MRDSPQNPPTNSPDRRPVATASRVGRGRTVAPIVVALLALSSRAADVQPAEAAQRNQTFTVTTTVQDGCTLVVGNMVFPNYTSGQSSILNGTSNFIVSCASATAGQPVPITYTVTAPGGFHMSHGASSLNYQLCFDPACSQLIPNGAGSAVLVDRATYSQPYYGQIFPRQTGSPGLYSQTVTATISF